MEKEDDEFTEINDIRHASQFKGQTFSNFNKTDVAKQLILSLQDSKIEPANYWTAELVSSGHFIELWDIIIQYYSKYIQLSNSKLIMYLHLRYTSFKDILHFGYQNDELRLRNNKKIRKLYSEIISVLCLSSKNLTFQEIKINPDDLTLTNITHRLKAPNIDLISSFFQEKDPKYLLIQFNEFVYNVDVKNSFGACYWLEHILKYEAMMKKRNELCVCEKRNLSDVANLNTNDIIWIFWEILLKYSQKNVLFKKIIRAAFDLFCIKYTSAITVKNKRKFLLYFAIHILCENENKINEKKIIENKDYISFVSNNINKIYQQIIINEVSPNTDYLFTGIKSSKNFEKTINLLEQLNTIEKDFIPRNEEEDYENIN